MASFCPFEPFLTRSYRRNEWSEDSKGSGDEGNEARSVVIVPGMRGRRVRAPAWCCPNQPRTQNLTALRTRRSVQPSAELFGIDEIDQRAEFVRLFGGRSLEVVHNVPDNPLGRNGFAHHLK